ncbi:pentapeptide repeat-containing protein [Actinomadura madurae]|uniref:pentapeptide repeat-containing protein n=1 Tax=Actinomadura madurae TaxID=1993 RepID=UPI0020D1FFDD|nr:pentapeptide repeat-containing protein [Actinomadura madurae]MCP9949326.1 pentapeptide repeat-containing protein [Actinomadura madurae]MCP9966083.1 pentapeptide repeat-containing protein [Actinomadura madurae]MCP9978568.1 pentapeptide repeat-containing protein [Actinomadura madurae]MCQ0009904.1 pentapeptide repeat-containing protein [Actinomadura madurae]MCQ0014770.1 pentapeptide repeat-containing protein [Actinomadura madurae]
MSQDEEKPGYRPVKDAHKTLGLWSIRRALTFAVTGAVALLVAAWFLVSWLLGSPPHAKPKPLETKDQLELLKLVFALVAGVGALVALVTAYRRQRIDEAASERAERIQAHAERVTRDAAHDATERRVTDLYGQAVEQLGHAKAPVRLGGLYSLERVAQDHARYRQTIVDVICAYLRMPYRLPSDILFDEGGTQKEADEAHEEMEVRRAAQDIICRHLALRDKDRPGRLDSPEETSFPETYWRDIRVNLEGAVLIGFNYSNCRPDNSIFSDVQFIGYTLFWGTLFTDNAWFSNAHFYGDVNFIDVRFEGSADFGGTRFEGDVAFIRPNFASAARFREVQFIKKVTFDSPTFSKEPDFTQSHVEDTDLAHEWPSNWAVDGHHLVRSP